MSSSSRSEALAAGQRSLLELIATGTSLTHVLEALARFIEDHAEGGALASILLLDRDGLRLRHGAAPSLPEEYVRAIDGAAIGPTAGSCGTAAYLGRETVTEDITSDPLWQDFAELARSHGLGACWSTPIFSTAGSVLGTFALYRRTPHVPDAVERELVAIATHLAGIAIERAHAEARLHEAERRYRALVEHLPLITYIDALDGESSNIYTSPQVEPLLGYSVEEWQSDPLLFVKTLHPDDRDRVLVAHAESHALGVPLTIEYRLVAKDGRTVWLRDGSIVLKDADGNPLSRQGYLLDITDRRHAEDQLRYQAFHDPLTGLPNRALFTDRVEHAVVARGHMSELGIAVLFLDLDDFKTVNDSLGHVAGDLLLKAVGHRLVDAVRAGDTVARFGGDEFAVLIEDISSRAEAAYAAERVAELLRVPFFVQGREMFITASMGIAFGHDAHELLRSADVAMYRAKSAGKAHYVFYESAMDDAAHTRLKLTADLQRAAFRGELTLEYQPTVDLATGHPAGLEALIRWNHPELGLIAPLDFVPLAEETALVVPIGRWALAEACSQATDWHARFPSDPPLSMSVNLSARQLQYAGLVDDVEAALSASRFPADLLMLELTESVLLGGGAGAIEALSSLKALGVRLALDDFGTGYSSLAYLRSLPVDTIKIDRSFIEETDARVLGGLPVLRGIIQLGHALGLVLVAEGIERPTQVKALRELGCSFGQGFHFWKPLRPDAVEELLASVANGPRAIRRASGASPGGVAQAVR